MQFEDIITGLGYIILVNIAVMIILIILVIFVSVRRASALANLVAHGVRQ